MTDHDVVAWDEGSCVLSESEWTTCADDIERELEIGKKLSFVC
jgi:hypothetical protein